MRTFTTRASVSDGAAACYGAAEVMAGRVPEVPPSLRGARVALAHDWLVTWRGGEKVLLAIAQLFPTAPIYTLFHQSDAMPAELQVHRIVPSVLDRLPGARRRHRLLLPLMPAAIRALRPRDVDLVVSSSHCVAKAIPVPRGARHLSYVHAPLRYMWDRFDDYFGPGRAPWPVRAAARALRPALRAWDVVTSTGVDRFVANSRHVATQIAQRYHRYARVIHPPVELERFIHQPLEGLGKGGYFLCLGALAPYKRVDLAIEAFGRLGLPLWIAGSGQSRAWLCRLPKNVKALGHVSDDEVVSLYRDARALVFPGVEDFGLTPLEAQACGRPVIAMGAGGALETVTKETGLFMASQTVEALMDAVRRFEAFEAAFRPEAARAQALAFTREAFQRALLRELDELVSPPRASG
jgi:glycosyltransferase involved in cell wall biosynthesis